MKKYLAIILGAVFVLGFAASAFAIHAEIPAETQAVVAKGSTQISIGGDLRFRGEATNNRSDFNEDKPDHQEYYDSRIRLSVEAAVTPSTKGMVVLEATSGPTGTVAIWGTDSTGSNGLYNAGNYKTSTINILEGWIQHSGSGLLGVPAGMKVGHMPLSLGNGIFFQHLLFGDDALVLFADPMKELHLGLLTIKFKEGSTSVNDDATGYVGLFAYKTKEFGISGDVTFVDDQNSSGTAGGPLAGPAAGPFVPTHFWNFGLRGNINVAGLGIKVDGEMQTGKVELASSDLKFRGYAFMAGLNYTLAPVKLSLDFAYASGDDNSSDAKMKAFVTAQDALQHFTYVYDYRTKNACGNQFGGLCNTMYIKGDVSAEVAKDLNAYLALYWLQAAKKINGVAGVPGHVTTTSKSIGTEIDAKITYKIDRNLNYFVEGGYLFAGNFWKSVTGSHPVDDAFAVRHGVQLSF
ncbi:MAG TPA: alginate export family protein [Thermodesulfovibrionales bacterium]|nr:alginate export family protein [Thermodesulfovibrionales bacterium]